MNRKIIEKIVASKKLSPRKLGLRFDRVALRLVNEIETTSTQFIPDGRVLLVAITAPIRLPSQTSMEINKKIEHHLSRKIQKSSFTFESCSNQVHIRLTKKIKNKKLTTLSFVHNPTANPVEIFDLIEKYLTGSL